jgi:alpha-glucosidase (family GH31 glycosyl hydrolase)
MLCQGYGPVFGQALDAGLLTETATGQPYLYHYSASTDDNFTVAQFDFANPATDAFYGGLLDEAVGDGYDGWMEDFGEYTPEDSVSHGGVPGTRMHNLYPVLYHRSSYRYARTQRRPVAGFIRSGWTGVHPYAQIVWGGDPSTDFGYDGITSAIRQALGLGTSGISRWGSDIGGFFALGQRRLTPEMLVRWIQLGAVSPIMRTEANGVALPPQSDRPQITDPAILPIWRRYAKLHTQLYPYLSAADAAYERTGMPIMRQLALVYPSDRRAIGRDDEYMFGPDLLAAPVIEPEAETRRLYLPRGRWVELWDAVGYREGSGGLRLGAARLVPGGRDVEVDAPLDELPLMARAGALIPMLPSGVDTLARYGGPDEKLVRLADRRNRIALLAFPRGTSRARFGERGRLLSRERHGRWVLRVGAPKRTRFRLQASLSTLRDAVRPCSVRIDGRRLPGGRWNYEPRSGRFVARFVTGAGGGRLVARGGRC